MTISKKNISNMLKQCYTEQMCYLRRVYQSGRTSYCNSQFQKGWPSLLYSLTRITNKTQTQFVTAPLPQPFTQITHSIASLLGTRQVNSYQSGLLSLQLLHSLCDSDSFPLVFLRNCSRSDLLQQMNLYHKARSMTCVTLTKGRWARQQALKNKHKVIITVTQ